MIITKTPLRISFVGGGSDLSDFYREHGGAVLSTSINQYMFISSHKLFEEGMLRLKYSETETVSDVSQVRHRIMRAVLEKFAIHNGLEIGSIADVPSGTGLGSSSSFTVCLLHNLYAKIGKTPSKERLASEACEIEIDILGEPIGKQDQYAAAYGGLNVIRFNRDDTVAVEPVALSAETRTALEEHLVMFYTGDQRSASGILAEQKKNAAQADKAALLKDMVALVPELKKAIETGNTDAFGEILNMNWELKRRLASGISNPAIEALYETALKNGARGGKLLGAGGGGFLLFYCEQPKQKALAEALGLRRFDFRFDSEGSTVVYMGE